MLTNWNLDSKLTYDTWHSTTWNIRCVKSFLFSFVNTFFSSAIIAHTVRTQYRKRRLTGLVKPWKAYVQYMCERTTIEPVRPNVHLSKNVRTNITDKNEYVNVRLYVHSRLYVRLQDISVHTAYTAYSVVGYLRVQCALLACARLGLITCSSTCQPCVGWTDIWIFTCDGWTKKRWLDIWHDRLTFSLQIRVLISHVDHGATFKSDLSDESDQLSIPLMFIWYTSSLHIDTCVTNEIFAYIDWTLIFVLHCGGTVVWTCKRNVAVALCHRYLCLV